jgi:hypothetical protein
VASGNLPPPPPYSPEKQYYISEIGVSAWFANVGIFDAAGIRRILMRFFRAHFSGTRTLSRYAKFETVLSKVKQMTIDVKHKNLKVMKKNIFRMDSS